MISQLATWWLGDLMTSTHQLTNAPTHQLRPFQELRHFFAFPQLDERLLPVRAAAGEASLPLDLAVRDAGPDAGNLRAEQLFDRAPDLELVRARGHLEDDRPAVFAEDRRFLGHQRAS